MWEKKYVNGFVLHIGNQKFIVLQTLYLNSYSNTCTNVVVICQSADQFVDLKIYHKDLLALSLAMMCLCGAGNIKTFQINNGFSLKLKTTNFTRLNISVTFWWYTCNFKN